VERKHAPPSVPGSAPVALLCQAMKAVLDRLPAQRACFVNLAGLVNTLAMPHAQVDAFASRAFQGNPAAVCLLDASASLDDSTRQSIAAEMCLSETAFVEAVPPGAQFATAEWDPPVVTERVQPALCQAAGTLGDCHVSETYITRYAAARAAASSCAGSRPPPRSPCAGTAPWRLPPPSSWVRPLCVIQVKLGCARCWRYRRGRLSLRRRGQQVAHAAL